MAEREEKLKSLLIRVKEESEKAGLKLTLITCKNWWRLNEAYSLVNSIVIDIALWLHNMLPLGEAGMKGTWECVQLFSVLWLKIIF